ncbi:MAG: glycosyltransferase [Candidatus Jacksonbacteria bacterium]
MDKKPDQSSVFAMDIVNDANAKIKLPAGETKAELPKEEKAEMPDEKKIAILEETKVKMPGGESKAAKEKTSRQTDWQVLRDLIEEFAGKVEERKQRAADGRSTDDIDQEIHALREQLKKQGTIAASAVPAEINEEVIPVTQTEVVPTEEEIAQPEINGELSPFAPKTTPASAPTQQSSAQMAEEELIKKAKEITAVKLDEKLEERAKDIGGSQLSQQLHKSRGIGGKIWGGFKKLVRHPIESAKDAGRAIKRLPETFKELNKRGWFLHIFEDYHRVKYIDCAKKYLKEEHEKSASGNFLAAQFDVAKKMAKDITDVRRQQGQAELQAIVERFAKARDEQRYLEQGETVNLIENQEKAEEINKQIGKLIKDYAVSGMTDSEFVSRRKEILTYIKDETGIDTSLVGDNIKEIADEMREKYSQHQINIDRVLENIDFQLGEFKSAITVKAKLSAAEKVVSWMQKHRPFGFIASPAVAGFTVSLVTGVFVKTTSLPARIFCPLGGGAAAGLTAAVLRKGKEFEQDYAEQAVDAGLGRKSEVFAQYKFVKSSLDAAQRDLVEVRRNGSRKQIKAARKKVKSLEKELESLKKEKERRELMQKVAHEARLWSELSNDLRDKARILSSAGPGEIAKLAAVERTITDAEARIKEGQEKAIQLRRFESELDVEQERLALRQALIECQQAVNNYKQRHPLTQEQNNQVEQARNQAQADLLQNITDKEKERKKVKRKEQIKAAVFGAVKGFCGGMVAQEAMRGLAELTGFDPLHWAHRQTMGRRLWQEIKGAGRLFGAQESVAGELPRAGLPEWGKRDFSLKNYKGIFERDGYEVVDKNLLKDAKPLGGTQGKLGVIDLETKQGSKATALIDFDKNSKTYGAVRGFKEADFSHKGINADAHRYIWGPDYMQKSPDFIVDINSAGKVMANSQDLGDYLKKDLKLRGLSFKTAGDKIEFFEKGNKTPIFTANKGDKLSILFDQKNHHALAIGHQEAIELGKTNVDEVGFSKDVQHFDLDKQPPQDKWGQAELDRGEKVFTGQTESLWDKSGFKPENLKDKCPRFDWHDEPGRHGFRNLFFEGKQQQGWIAVDKDGNLLVDARNMYQNLLKNIEGKVKPFGLNWDRSVDTRLQHLYQQMLDDYKSGKMSDRIKLNLIPTQADDSAGRGVLLGSMDSRGMMHVPDQIKELILSKDPDVQKAINEAIAQAKQSGRFVNIITEKTDKLKPKFLFDHLEYYYEGEHDGKTARHVFATLTGTGEMKDVLTPVAAPLQDTMIAPAPTGQEFVPPLFVPWEKRKSLEPAWESPPGIIYYGHYGNMESGEYEQRRSPRFNNPEVELNEREELEWYFNQQSPEYLQELESLDQQIQEPMSEHCRIVVAIPAYKEEFNIYHTLEQYVNQKDEKSRSLNSDSFEIIILDNHPEDKTRDGTKEEIEHFKADYPEINVRYVYKIFKKEEVSIGNIRKYLNDLALLRAMKRKRKDGSLILVSNDADLEKIANRYLDDIRRTFDNNRKIDAITGKLDYPKDAYMQLPILHSARRLWQYFDIILRHKYFKAPELSGANSAFRAEIYAALGGYNPRSGLGEDLEMGWMLKRARRNKAPEHMKYLNRAEVKTDPRRAILNYLEGRSHIKQHEDFITNGRVRELTWEQLLPEDRDAFEREVFEREADSMYQFYRRLSWLPNSVFSQYFARAMDFLGAKYHFENEHVKVDSVQKLQRRLEDFRNKIEN